MAASTLFPAATPSPAVPRLPLRALPAAGRRGGAVAVLAAVALAGAVTLGALAAAPAAAGPVAAAGVGTVVVAPGEALWDVAVRTAGPGTDPRAQFRDLVLTNRLDPTADLAPWTILTLPTR
jgi:hypothetical protein